MSALRTSQDVILSPVISEKSYSLQEMNKYIFRVHKSANKVQIRKAIEEMFPGVKVAKINTANILGKKRRRGRVEGKRPDWKKATISLREGEIDLFEQV
jgi:large subunit ribosomal protein L23